MIEAFAALMELQANGADVFIGPPPPDRGLRTYGGQLLAQSIGAAQRTASDDRLVHSIHSYFLKGADSTRPVKLHVERLRDGRSFSQRQVIALQDDAQVFRSLISFHVAENGLEWQQPITIDVPPPSDERPYVDYNDFTEALLLEGERPWSGRDRPIDVRYINAPTTSPGQLVTEPQRMWMRMQGQLGDDQARHAAALAYLADTGMNAVLPLPHGRNWRDEQLTLASLDHTIWFHRPTRADDWLHFEQQVESTALGRGLASSRFYDRAGVLVATCMQEGLLRSAE